MLHRVLVPLILCVALTGGGQQLSPQVTPTGPGTAAKPSESAATEQAIPAASTNPQAGASTACMLPDGTPVTLRLTHTVSTALARVNDPIRFEVVEEIRVGDAVVIPKGSHALGTVVETKGKRFMGRQPKLAVRLNHVELATGQKAPIRGARSGEGGGAQGEMGAYMAATGLLFFPAAPLALLVRGHDASIPRGTTLTGYIDGNFALDLKKSGAMPGNKPRPE